MTIAEKLTIAEDALRSITARSQCERYTTGLGSCFTQGRKPNAQMAIQRCCDPCIADWALKRIEPPEKPDGSQKPE